MANENSQDVNDVGTGEEHEGEQVVIFALGGGKFAAPMRLVQEIIRVPDTVRVPLAPSHLSGLGNLRGRVLPIFSLRHMLGMEDVVGDESTRALVIRVGTPLGFLVDKVHSVMTFDPGQIEPASRVEGSIDSEWLSGMIRRDDDVILLIDVEKLLQQAGRAWQGMGGKEGGEHFDRQESETVEQKSNQDEWHLVSFEVANQEYATPIESVQEIVQAPQQYTEIPNSPPHILGLMVLRQRLLPLVSLRCLFGLPQAQMEEHHRVVVLQLGQNLSVGVVMDRVHEVLRVPKSTVEGIPKILENTHSARQLSAMCRLDGGKRIVSVLNIDAMFDLDSLREAMDTAGASELGESQMSNFSGSDEEGSDDELQTVVFRLGDEEFGVPINAVQEIVRVPEQLTHVPQSPSFVEGVINLRGTVLPVIDQRRRMAIHSGEKVDKDRQRIMVYLVNGVRTGFIVDSVSEVLKIPRAAITPSPATNEESAALIPEVANMSQSKRMVLLIDPQALLSGRELSELGIEGVSADHGAASDQDDGIDAPPAGAGTGGGLKKSKSGRKENADTSVTAVLHD